MTADATAVVPAPSARYVEQLVQLVRTDRRLLNTWNDVTFHPAELVRVSLAAACALDRYRPDWYRRLDLDRLDLASTRLCVLGQVYGDYATGWDAVVPRAAAEGHGRVSLGFSAFASRDVWIAEVWRRLHHDVLDPVDPVDPVDPDAG